MLLESSLFAVDATVSLLAAASVIKVKNKLYKEPKLSHRLNNKNLNELRYSFDERMLTHRTYFSKNNARE